MPALTSRESGQKPAKRQRVSSQPCSPGATVLAQAQAQAPGLIQGHARSQVHAPVPAPACASGSRQPLSSHSEATRQAGAPYGVQELALGQEQGLYGGEQGVYGGEQGLAYHSDDGSLERMFDGLPAWGGGAEMGLESGILEADQASQFGSASPADSCLPPLPAGGLTDTPSPAWSLQTSLEGSSHPHETFGLLASLLQSHDPHSLHTSHDAVSSSLGLPSCLRMSSHEYGDLRDVVGPEVLHGSIEGVVPKATLIHEAQGLPRCNAHGHLGKPGAVNGDMSTEGDMSPHSVRGEAELFEAVPTPEATKLAALATHGGKDTGLFSHSVAPTLSYGVLHAMLSELAR